MKKIIYFLLLLVLCFQAYSQTDWKTFAGDIDGYKEVDDLDNSFLTSYSTTYIPSGYYSNNDVLIGNLDNNSNTKEIIFFDSPNYAHFFLYNLTGSLIYYTPYVGDYHTQFSYVLYDFDNDNQDEIFIILGNKTSNEAYPSIYKYVNNNLTLIQKTKITQKSTQKTPVCYQGYCYFQDNYGRIYKYNPTTNSIVSSINLGSYYTGSLYRIIIGNYSKTSNSLQLIYVIDSDDADSSWNNFVVTPLNSFTSSSSKVYNASFSRNIQEKVNSFVINNEIYSLLQSQIYSSSAGSSCGFPTVCSYYNVYNNFFLYKLSSNNELIELYNKTLSGYICKNLDYPIGLSGHIITDFNNDNLPELCIVHNINTYNPLYGSCSYRQKSVIALYCFNYTGSIIQQNYDVNLEASQKIGHTANMFLTDINFNGKKDIITFDSYAFELETNITNSYSSFSSPQKAFINLGEYCTQFYSILEGKLNYVLSSNPYCDYNFENQQPSIISSSYSDTNIDVSESVYVNVTGQDYENDVLCWAKTCDYNDEMVTSGRWYDIGFENRTQQDNLIFFNTFDTYNKSFQSYYEGGTLEYVMNVSIGSFMPNQFWINVTNTTQGLDYDSMTNSFIVGFRSDYMLIHAGMKSKWKNTQNPFNNLLTDSFYVIGYSKCDTNLNCLYRLKSNGYFELLHTSTEIEDRLFIEMNWNDKKYRIKSDDSFDGDIDYTSSWFDFLNTDGTLLTSYYLTSGNNISDNSYLNDIQFFQPISSYLNSAFMTAFILDYEDLGNITYNCNNANPYTFTCSYTSLGTKTIRTWLTDVNHLSSTNVYTSQDILVTESGIGGENCSGYVPQSCTGSCYFTDNFNYNNPLYCAGWSGLYQYNTPTNNTLLVTNSLSYERGLTLDKGYYNSILSSQYNNFSIEFDLKVLSNDIISFNVYDRDLNKNVLSLQINNYVLKAYTNTQSYTLATLSYNTNYKIKLVIDFQTNTISYFIDNSLILITPLYETGVTSARRFEMSWVTQSTTFLIDNFLISYGSYSSTYTNVTETPGIEYTYNPDLFCAINWTKKDGKKFSVDNCRERGFSTEYPLLSLCIPRACIQDLGLMLLDSATKNIYSTIIIVIAIILIAPLLIALLRKR